MRRLALYSVLTAVILSAGVWTVNRPVDAAAAVRPVPAAATVSPATAVAVVNEKPRAAAVHPIAQPRAAAVHLVAVARPKAPAPTRTTTPVVRPHPVPPVVAARPVVRVTRPAAAPEGGCAAALAYLAAHAAPGFTLECPGNALGHQAMTCIDEPGICPGQKVIAIAVACPASWMNEASNSWVLSGLASRAIDPYGHCG